MSNKSLVSVIIPCYNYAHFLKDAVDSLINQTLNSWECLIIDDGSTDDTKTVASMLMKEDSRIKYYYRQNMGLAASRNWGLKLSKGNYIQFLDADDMIHPHKLQEQVEILDNNRSIGISYTNYQTFQGDISNLTGRYSYLNLGDNSLEDFLFKWERGLSIPIHAALFRRSLFKKNSNPFIEGLRAKEDWVMWVKLAMEGNKFSFLDKDYCLYRRHNTNQTIDFKAMMNYYLRAIFAIFVIIPAEYHEKFINCSLKHVERFYLGSILNQLSVATLFYDNGEGFNAIDNLFQSIDVRENSSFTLTYNLLSTDKINQLRFDPFEGQLAIVKLTAVKYFLKSGEIKELDLTKVTSNGAIRDDGFTIFNTYDPMYFLPISGELQKIIISGEIIILENKDIEKLLSEKEQLLSEKEQLLSEKEQLLSELINSNSWRITAPLRKIHNWVRRYN